MKYIVVTGGVVSGIGKGIVSASIGKLLQTNFNLNVLPIKCDGYLNTDPGTINPIEHGEVYVLDDGTEVDMDFGHYERFMDVVTKKKLNLTMGKIFKIVIDKERKGIYLGKTVQLIPHVTNEIIRQFETISKSENADICIIEIGGTIGDIENMLYIESVRQLRNKLGKENVCFVHLTYVPYIAAVGEQKSKPTQQSVHMLMETGIYPDFLICRSEYKLNEELKTKIALFTNIPIENIISNEDVRNIYEIPISLENEGVDKKIGELLKLENYENNMQNWKKLIENIKNPKTIRNIAIAGKYMKLKDSYASVIEAIKHAATHLEIKPEITWIDTTDLDYENTKEKLKNVDALIVPGGFGARGTEGKINAIRFARENNIPFLGLCYGLQMAVVEFARNISNLCDANSTEINPETKYPVIDILPEQKEIQDLGGTMRLGKYKACVKEGTIVHNLYNNNIAYERHRHRYEVNPKFHKILIDNGLILSGVSENGRLVEFIELPKEKHKYFVATQAHPELKSKFEKPSPLFYGLLKATLE